MTGPALGPTPWAIASPVWPGTAKLIEEMGELQQVLGKLIALGEPAVHWDGSDLRERLVEECGDVLGALQFFVNNNDVDRDAVVDRAAAKERMFEGWHAERGA